MSATVPPPVDEPRRRPYEPYERPGLVIAYLVGSSPIMKGEKVGVDAAGLLVPILKAEAFVGIANEFHAGNAPGGQGRVNVTVCGTFVFGFVGWKPTTHDLHRKVWAFDGTTVAPAPLRSNLVVGRIIAIETTFDGRDGVRIKIDEAVGRALSFTDEQTAGVWEWYLSDGPPSGS